MWRDAPSWSTLLLTSVVLAWISTRYFSAYNPSSSSSSSSFSTTIFLLLTLFTALRHFWTIYIWPRYRSSLLYLPQPDETKSFWGSIKFITVEECGVRHRDWINSIPNEGLLRYVVLGGQERIFLTSPKAIAEAFVTRCYDYQRPPIAHEILSRVLGHGLLLAEGDEHRVQRKNLTPAFSVPHVKDLIPSFYAISARMVQGLTEDVCQQAEVTRKEKGGEVEVVEGTVPFHTWISRATLDIIGAAGMGVDFGAVSDPNNELSVTYREVFDLSVQEQILQLCSLFVSFRWLQYLPVRRNREVYDGIAKIRAVSRSLIEKKQHEINSTGTSQHKDILSIALGSGHFTVDSLVDQVMTFLAAGHETTSTASQWAMVVLARNKDIQDRLRHEIREVLPPLLSPSSSSSSEGGNEQVVTSDTLDKLPYLKAFCNELLRFYPPVTFTQRVAIADTLILGHRIPKGTDIVVVPAAMNFSKELWGEDADEFNPDRWLRPGCANTGGADSAYALMTFTSGPRGCIGAAFARYEFQCLVATIIGRFEVALEDDGEIKSETSVVTRPKGGLPLRMKVVGGW